MLLEYINMKNNEMMRLVLIVVAFSPVFIYLIHSYNNTNNLEQENFLLMEKTCSNSP